MTRYLARDRMSWIVFAVGLACLAPTILHLGTSEAIDWFNSNLSDPIMVTALIIAIFSGWRAIATTLECTFWKFWGIGFALLLAAHLIRIGEGAAQQDGALFLLRSLLLVGFYALAALALELRPHMASDTRGQLPWMHRLETSGVLILATGLYVYFAVVPFFISPESEPPSSRVALLLLGFDLYLSLRLVEAVRTSTNRRWRATYALLLAAILVWLAADISILLGFLKVVGYGTFQTVLDWLWLPPYLAFLWAIRLREWQEEEETSEENARDLSTDELRTLTIETARSTLWFHAGMLPVLHVILETAGLLQDDAQLSQQGCALVVLLLNGILAVAYQTRLESENVSLANEREQAVEAARQAYHDPLTGLPNRYLLVDHLQLGIAQARRDGRLVAVFFIDIDRFKTINDSLGHSAGDQLLVQIASRFTYCLRSTDTLARLGGDEFIVVAPGLHLKDDVILVGQKLLDGLRAPFTLESTELFVTASIGIAVFPDSGSDTDGILRDADIAMYRAKAQGGGTLQIYDADKFGETVSRLSMETMLRRAVFNEAFVLHFQPVVNIDSGLVTGCEALIRWVHPERGLLMPAEFLDMAETCGVTSRLTPWLLEEACRWVSRWQARYGKPLRIAVNLSARQFLDSRFGQFVEKALESSGIPGEMLELEVTESVAMQSIERMVQTLNGLKKMNVRVAIDDFGTGYSSLYALRTLPIDTLKIDQSFVKGIATNHSDAAITSTILAVADTLGLDVVAEGVETIGQLDVLAKLGCHTMQGYLFSPPIPPEGIPDLLGETLLPQEYIARSGR